MEFALAPGRVYHSKLSPTGDPGFTKDFSPFPLTSLGEG